MKKLFLLFTAMLLSISSYAFTFQMAEGVYMTFYVISESDSTGTVGVDRLDMTQAIEGSITIPSTVSYNGKIYSVKTIGNDAFYGCSGLTSIEIPNGVTSIGSNAFYGCSGLTFIEIPNGVTSMGYGAFEGCSGLTSIEIPSSVTYIDIRTFSYCSSLMFIEIPSSVTGIGDEAFRECSSLTSIEIPNSVTSIGDYAFYQCSALTSIEIPSSVTSIKNYTFEYCSGLSSITIPSSVTSIGERAFSGCNGLTSIEILNGVTSIGNSAFSYCSGLTSVTIPSSVTDIGDDAFHECSGLTSATIPNSVTNIGYEAFRGCSNMQQVYCYRENVPNTLERVFYDVPLQTAILYVPASAIEQYRATAPWSGFGTILAIDGEHSDSTLNDGDIFIAQTVEGVEMTFKVISAADRTVQVGSGDTHAIAEFTAGVVTVPSTFSYMGEEFEVTGIGSHAFNECFNLNAVSIPESVTNIESAIFEGCSSLASIEWNSTQTVTNEILGDVGGNPNFLLYVKDAEQATGLDFPCNVLVNRYIASLTLHEGYNYYAAQPFTVDEITYTHTYTMKSGMGESQGWESIVLPFKVQTITHESAGALTPFALYQEAAGEKPFWLSELTATGWQTAKWIEANKPYIICMPNNEAYDEEYNVAGTVTFSARNLAVPRTEAIVCEGNGMTLIPALQKVEASASVFAINKNEVYEGNPAGSVFVRNLRAVSPFEAYVKQDAGAKQRNVIRIGENNITDITELTTEEGEATPTYYTLDGRPLQGESVTTGIYLVKTGNTVKKVYVRK